MNQPLDLIYFSSVTRNTERFISKLTWDMGTIHTIPYQPGQEAPTPTSPYILMCPSYGDARRGHVPPQVRKFLSLEENRNLAVAVVGTGNINFGTEYAYAADAISSKLQIPILYKLELAGTTADVDNLEQIVRQFQQTLTPDATPAVAAL